MPVTRPPDGPERSVGKIVGVGRNFRDHAREMGHDAPGEPLLFLKPPGALVPGGGLILLPSWSEDVHHEVEMVVRLGRVLCDADAREAARAVDAVAVGLDLTARDVQKRAKERGEPWAVAKGFDGSAPVSAFRAVPDAAAVADLELRLAVNGTERQRGRTRDMIWPVPELLAFASSRMTLEPGDLVFTGTPAGVGPVRAGDHVEAWLGDLSLVVMIQARGPAGPP